MPKRSLPALLLPAAMVYIASSAAAWADVEKYNIAASRAAFPFQNLSGNFYYDTSTGSIPNWNVVTNGNAAANTNFIPPSSDTLQPCGSGCSANLSSSLNPAVSGGELNFFDSKNPAAQFYVGLGLPLNYSLAG